MIDLLPGEGLRAADKELHEMSALHAYETLE